MVLTAMAVAGQKAMPKQMAMFSDNAPSPAELFRKGISFEHEVRRGDPGAEKIHPARERQQEDHQAKVAASEC